MSDIWQHCHGDEQIRPVAGTLYRLIENQEQVATLSYVDSLAEQSVLEDLLERSKPPYPNGVDSLHYLFKTPFRYPPLPWGSRFGQRHEAGIFYGGGSVQTTLAEAAFYRFVFWRSIASPPVKPAIRSQHSLFSARYRSDRGVQLQLPPFDEFVHELTHPASYSASQHLGAAMRTAGIEAFEYTSARDENQGHCIGLFSPAALADKQPVEILPYLCVLTANDVSFKSPRSSELYQFNFEDFVVAGELPFPATTP
ncbi:MAG: RES family NAD+ phosphorylase [Pseudohongiella sp.]|nr:RES family NAD+ phosphorylase [Pseudohongiella sp.]MDP2286905.1 RES family NAD+ phosphorylase [Pseudohongiella sp.]